jgi:hypothetical protein
METLARPAAAGGDSNDEGSGAGLGEETTFDVSSFSAANAADQSLWMLLSVAGILIFAMSLVGGVGQWCVVLPISRRCAGSVMLTLSHHMLNISSWV